jgi:hypothetical protein
MTLKMKISTGRLSNSLIDRDNEDIDRDLLAPEKFTELYPVENLSKPKTFKEPGKVNRFHNALIRLLWA